MAVGTEVEQTFAVDNHERGIVAARIAWKVDSSSFEGQ